METKNFEYYRKEVFLPYIEKLREKYSNEKNSTSDKVVSWIDGGPSQLSLIIDEETQNLDEVLNIVTCKHAAATTAVQQAADISPIFKIIRKLSDYSSHNITRASYGYEKIVHEIFQKTKSYGSLNLKANVESALIDHIICCPEIYSRSINYSTVTEGFKGNGMIDIDRYCWPDFDKIIATCRRQITNVEKNLILETFPFLYKEMLTKGYISDELFDQLNYPIDTDESGNNYERHVEITDEKCQRAKIMNHYYQRNLRNEVINKRKVKENEANQKLKETYNDWIKKIKNVKKFS